MSEPIKRTFKETKKVSGVQKMYRKWAEYDIGDVVIGKYVESHEDQYKHNCPVLEVEDAQFKDKSGAKYIGKNIVLNSTGMLAKAFEKIQIGQFVQIEYQGTSEIPKGPYKGKEAHLTAVTMLEEDDGSESQEMAVTDDDL